MSTRYRRLAILTKGRFGKVWLLECVDTGLLFAGKELSGGRPLPTSLFHFQLTTLTRLSHPHLIRCHDYYFARDSLGIVTEFCDGGDLFCHLEMHKILSKPLAEESILKWWSQLCSALGYMHSKYVLHGAISPWSIFLTGSQDVKLGGFTASRFLDNWKTSIYKHVPSQELRYTAPEIRHGQPLEYSADIWSLGCVLFEMITLQHPETLADLYSETRKTIPSNCFNNGLLQLLKSMLNEDPTSRPSAQNLHRQFLPNNNT